MENNIDENFNDYYQKTILPVLQNIEKIRLKYLIIFLSILIFVIFWLYSAISNFMPKEESEGSLGYILDNLYIILIMALLFPMFAYYIKSKEKILPLLVNFFGEFEYEYQKNFSKDIMEQSEIISKKSKIEFDDTFCGLYKDIPVEIIEYKLSEKINNEEKFSQTKQQRGILFYAKMNKKFSGQTIIVKDKGVFNILQRYPNKENVKLESLEFEKYFEVYSDNQIEARYILTTTMIECIMQLRRSFNKISLSFFNNHILINIETKHNAFECNSFFRSIINKKRIEKNFNELKNLFLITETLKLTQNKIF